MKLPKEYFLYVGNAYPHKNLERLIKALNILISQYPNIFLILVGTEDYFYKQLKKKVEEMDLEEKVIFYGEATREKLNNLYKNALALVFPSLMEGFGLPGLEAMANGCPVVCSDIPVFREIYGEATTYFDPTDTGDIKNKLVIVCSSVIERWNRGEMVKRGLEQVKKYSWQKLAQQTLEVYQSVLK